MPIMLQLSNQHQQDTVVGLFVVAWESCLRRCDLAQQRGSSAH
jgi:hypothetical protein